MKPLSKEVFAHWLSELYISNFTGQPQTKVTGVWQVAGVSSHIALTV